MAKKMTDKNIKKQRVAACLSKTGGDQDKMGSCISEFKNKHPKGRVGPQKKGLKESMDKFDLTFKEFLTEMDARSYIRAMPMYQELIKDQQHKPAAMQLARSLAQEFGNEPMSREVMAYIQDEMDHLYSQTIGKHGSMVGDWKGEREWHERRQQDRDIGSAIDKWEQATGMDAETGADIDQYDDRGRLRHGARPGMEFRPKVKQQRIAAELRGHGDERPTIQRRAAQGLTHDDDAYRGGPSKATMAKEIVFDGLGQGKSSGEIIQQLINDVPMSKNGARTYFYKYKKRFYEDR